jgi:hypothetical protein
MEVSTPQLIQGTADGLLKGHTLRIDDPFIVAEVIDELNARRIEALQNCDYKTGQKIKDAIDAARLQFRQHDRDVLHREILARLDERYKEAVAASSAAKEKWKKRHQELQQSQRLALTELNERQEDEHRQLEEEWVQPETLRQFDKRSSTLLQNRQIEQYMALCGNLPGADQMKRINAQTEKMELQHRHKEMAVHFEIARANLLRQHQREIQNLKMDQESDTKILIENDREDMGVKARRVEATQRVLTEEKDYQRFIRKKFHRSAEIVVPTTVLACREGSDDLPPMPHGRVVPATVAPMLEFRKKIVVTRLPLTSLSIPHYRPPSLLKAAKAKKADV